MGSGRSDRAIGKVARRGGDHATEADERQTHARADVDARELTTTLVRLLAVRLRVSTGPQRIRQPREPTMRRVEMPVQAKEPLLTVRDVAESDKTSEKTVRRAIAAGLLDAIRVGPGGRILRITREAHERYRGRFG